MHLLKKNHNAMPFLCQLQIWCVGDMENEKAELGFTATIRGLRVNEILRRKHGSIKERGRPAEKRKMGGIHFQSPKHYKKTMFLVFDNRNIQSIGQGSHSFRPSGLTLFSSVLVSQLSRFCDSYILILYLYLYGNIRVLRLGLTFNMIQTLSGSSLHLYPG